MKTLLSVHQNDSKNTQVVFVQKTVIAKYSSVLLWYNRRYVAYGGGGGGGGTPI